MESHANLPLVSVVIPASSLSEALTRSVLSALAQTLTQIEVIVVATDPDGLSKQLLSPIKDARLKIKTLPSHAAFGDLVNEGVRQAQSPWIAFLHEYDEWLPRKLELQFQKAQSIDPLYPVISCRLIARSKGKEMIWPRRTPSDHEDLSEYLFCQKTPFYGEGMIKFSTILTKKELLIKVPFDASLIQHEDYDWLLRMKSFKGVLIAFADTADPLAIWSMEGEAKRPKNGFDLDATLSWQQNRKQLFTPRAYACFLLTGVSREVNAGRNLKTFFRLLQEAYRYGKPSMPDLLWFFLVWVSPQGMRHRMANTFSRASRSLFSRIQWIFPVALLGLYIGLVFYGILHHEMWRDELQAWLIARDSHTVPQLFENFRYEKHPFLWYILLYGLTRLTDNPFSMQMLHLVIAASALAVFLFFSPFSKLQKFLFSFGYFPFYEYAVKSRNYALGVLFVFSLCACIPERKNKYLLIAALLFLLCQTSVFGLVLALTLGCALIAEACFDAGLRRELSQKKGYAALSLAIFLAGIMVSACQIMPTPEDWSSIMSGSGMDRSTAASALRNISHSYLPGGDPPRIKAILGISKTQDFYLACALLVFSIFLFLGKPFVLSWYVLGTFGILLFFCTLYKGQTRHHGNLFILWIACAWIAHYFKRIRLKPQWLDSLPGFFQKAQTPLLFLMLSVHFGAGIQAHLKDWKFSYSPNQEAAKFIKENQLDQMVWVGHEDAVASPLTAYFRKKIYSVRGGRFGSFVVFGPQRKWTEIADQEVLQKARKITRHSKKDVLLILSEKLDTTPDSVIQLEQFTNGLSSSEKYYLYLMKYVKTV